MVKYVSAAVLEGPEEWTRGTVRLMVMRGDAVLMDDGSWVTATEGTTIGGAGIVLPRDAMEPISDAIRRWQGVGSHAATEAAILREWLISEKERVDGLIYAANDRVRRRLTMETLDTEES